MRYLRNKKEGKLFKTLRKQHQNKLPFVVYRNPGSLKIRALLQNDSTLLNRVDFSKKGFVFSPFSQDSGETIFLRADHELKAAYDLNRDEELVAVNPIQDPIAQEIHIKLVQEAQEAIKNGAFKKVVVSRRFSVPFSEDLFYVFQNFIATYPNAFCYLWVHPKIGTWLGATPELLCKFKQDTLETMALAGTLKIKNKGLPDWTAKEKDEQAWVSDYIRDILSKYSDSVDIGDRHTIRAGQLWHLRTNISGRVSSADFEKIIYDLHPTPAVCGIPKEAAKDFILKHENYNREYYTGFLGEINVKHEGQFRLFVNLRCAQLRGDKALIYTGGGITKDSVPEKEWEEIQDKSLTLLRGLKISTKKLV